MNGVFYAVLVEMPYGGKLKQEFRVVKGVCGKKT
jgi:hypothetical protein